MSSHCLVDGVIDQFEDHVMETRTVIGITDVHAGPLAHRIQPLEHLDALGSVFRINRVIHRLHHVFLHFAALSAPCSTWNNFISFAANPSQQPLSSLASTQLSNT